jgi:glycosyltransferase involved in cell wall biosynthesis
VKEAAPASLPMVNVLIGRQLHSRDTGNGAYLMIFLRTARAAGLGVRLVMAPSRAFSNRPWMTLHPAYRPLIDEIVWPRSLRFGDRFVSLSPSVWGRFGIRLGKAVAQKLGVRSGPLVRVHSTLADVIEEKEAEDIARASDACPSAIVLAEYSSLGPVLARLSAPVRKAVLLHDLFSLRAESFRARGQTPDFDAPTLDGEAERVKDADLLLYASANELARLASLLPAAKSVWLRPEVPAYPDVAPDAPARAVFLGTRHAGNVDALRTLVDDIWPLVRGEAPDAELHVAGSICQDLTQAQATRPGVRLLGRVEDLATLGGAGSIGLAPTRLASGVSIKVAEYLRLGMPCVAYPLALEGFGPELDDLVDIADGPEAFARKVVELLNDPAARLARSKAGRAQSALRLDNAPVVQAIRALVSDPGDSSAPSTEARDHFDSDPPASLAPAGFAASSRHS